MTARVYGLPQYHSPPLQLAQTTQVLLVAISILMVLLHLKEVNLMLRHTNIYKQNILRELFSTPMIIRKIIKKRRVKVTVSL